MRILAQENSTKEDDSTMIYDQEDSADIVEGITGDTIVSKSAFSEEKDSIQKWRNSADFKYVFYLDSLLRKQAGLKTDTVSIDKNTGKKHTAAASAENNPNSLLNSFPVKIFLWSVAIFFIGFIIYKLFFSDGLFAKRNTRITKEPPENIPEGLNEYSEYNQLINEAEQKKDFNLSARYLYLQTLKRLADRELIQFSPDKTNYSYVRELSVKNYQQAFASLTLNYEFVWYGKFIITENQYSQLKQEFISFNKNAG